MVPEETGGCDNRVLDGEEDLLVACITPTLIVGDKGEEACKGNLPLATGEAKNNQLHTVLYEQKNDNNVVSKFQISLCSI